MSLSRATSVVFWYFKKVQCYSPYFNGLTRSKLGRVERGFVNEIDSLMRSYQNISKVGIVRYSGYISRFWSSSRFKDDSYCIYQEVVTLSITNIDSTNHVEV